MSKLRKRTANIFLTIFIGLIVISFIFTGMQGMQGTPNSVAQVGSHSIKVNEYQQEFNRQLEFFSSLRGGESLSTQEIKQFQVRQTAINNLVNAKLSLIAAERIGLKAPSEEIKKQIKNLPYFQNNGQFSLSAYKQVLSANQLTPQEFEENISEGLKTQKFQKLSAQYPVSQSYSLDIKNFKKKAMLVDIVEITKSSLRSVLKITDKEVQKFLSVPDKLKLVKSRFELKKNSLGRPKQVKARHILLTEKLGTDKEILRQANKIKSQLSAKNFIQMAKKHTMEPGGKERGGQLDWFAKGEMVEAFENKAFSMNVGEISKPIKSNFGYHIIYKTDEREEITPKFEKFKKQLAKEIMRESMDERLSEKYSELQQNVAKALKNNQESQLKRLEKDYKFSRESQISMNLYNGVQGDINLKTNQVFKIFKKDQDFYPFDSTNAVQFVKVNKRIDKENKTDLTQEKNSLRALYSNKFRQEINQYLRDQEDIEIYRDLIGYGR